MYAECMEELEAVEVSAAEVEVFVLVNVYLSHAATLFLLGGGTLVQLFDGSLPLVGGAPGKSRPLFLALSAIPRLDSPPPFIPTVTLGRIRALRPGEEAARIDTIRTEVATTIFHRRLHET